MRYLIYSETDGVYLGNCMGLGFWSRLDPAGQDCAVTFKSEQEARLHIASWDCPAPVDTIIKGIDYDNRYITADLCCQLNLGDWTDTPEWRARL